MQPGEHIQGELIINGRQFPVRFLVSTDSAIHVPEPLYDLAVAATLIPCTPETMKHLLSIFRQRFPAIYRSAIVEGRNRRSRKRVLRATEILKMRSILLYGPGVDTLKEDGQLIGLAHIFPRYKRALRSPTGKKMSGRDWASHWKAQTRERRERAARLRGEPVQAVVPGTGQEGSVRGE